MTNLLNLTHTTRGFAFRRICRRAGSELLNGGAALMLAASAIAIGLSRSALNFDPAKTQVRTKLAAGGRRIRTLGPRQKDNAFRASSFPTCARHRRLRKRSPPRPAAASSSCRSRSDERRTHSPTRRSSGPPDRRHHHPFALITALCFFRVRFISCSCAVALSRGRAPP